MRLLLIRHGETHSNVVGALDTAVPGAPLDDRGQRQAAAIPAALAREAIDSIVVSTLIRTQQTAAAVAEERSLEPMILDGVKEIQAGSLEMLSDRHSQNVYNTTAWAWAGGDLELRMPGGETGHEFFDRFDAAIGEATATRRGTVVVVSHGAAIRTWVAARCDNTDGGDFASTHQLANTALVELNSLGHRDWHLDSWGHQPLGGAELINAAVVDPIGMHVR